LFIVIGILDWISGPVSSGANSRKESIKGDSATILAFAFWAIRTPWPLSLTPVLRDPSVPHGRIESTNADVDQTAKHIRRCEGETSRREVQPSR
jgi:hypothetical protein